ncbi:MAG: hypothetical protein QE265_06470 [Rhodoferax sp.]|nr:hypothetical protein [Rhodoferax sp.]
MSPLRRGALGIAVVWWLLCAGLAYWQAAPALPRKIVTLQLEGLGTARFAFSAAQHDHEIVYDMKTLWVPRLQAQPPHALGTIDDAPYQAFVRSIVYQQWPFAALALVPAVGLWWAWRRSRPQPAAAA